MKPPEPLTRARPLWLGDARRELLWSGLFALLVLGIGIGLRDPWPSDEPRFALVARWMVEHGQWLFPHRGHELYPDKPPVFMWMQALAYVLTRSWRIAFLLPSLLSALGALALVYDLARRLWNHRSGLLAALSLLVTIHFTYQMRDAQIDPLLLGWITLANYGLLRHLLLGPAWRWFWIGCFFAGVGVVTKGVGVLALLMLVPFAFARRRGWRHVARFEGGAGRWALGALAFLLPVLGWLLPMVLIARADGDPQHAEYVRNILFGQTVHRYAAPPGHLHSIGFFVGIIAADWLPLSLLLPWAIPAWWRRLKRRDARFLLPLGWIVLTLVFFSLSPGKRDVYILPSLPITALALAPMLPALLRRTGVRRAVFALTAGLAGTLVLAGTLALTRHPAWAQKIDRGLDPRIWWLFLAMGAAGLVIVALTRVRRAPLGWVAFAAVLWSLYGLWGYPLLNADRSALGVMEKARAIAGPDATIGLVAWKEQNLLMAQGPVAEFGFLKPWPRQFADAVSWLRADPDHRWLFSLDTAMGNCVTRDKATYVGHANRREWWMFRSDAVVPGCTPKGQGSDDDGLGD
ncbi:MAG: glycosyltransferase family 39 protein [Xanthomonadaceae bacterium]|nr:glycosyltransferase family 39 protein [Xanthomonadaceae bacterium]MDE1964570.1 glycosyltransferase family 39 protein [Xanthomonadaceae bacterium]